MVELVINECVKKKFIEISFSGWNIFQRMHGGHTIITSYHYHTLALWVNIKTHIWHATFAEYYDVMMKLPFHRMVINHFIILSCWLELWSKSWFVILQRHWTSYSNQLTLEFKWTRILRNSLKSVPQIHEIGIDRLKNWMPVFRLGTWVIPSLTASFKYRYEHTKVHSNCICVMSL